MTDNIPTQDRTILRDLASQYAELASSERNLKALERWRTLNNMKSDRPLVICNTGHLWPEIDPQLPALQTSGKLLQRIERRLQQELWQSTLPDDRHVDPWFTVRAKVFQHPEGLWGISPRKVQDPASRGWRHMPVLEEMEDLDQLKATDHKVLDPDPPMAQIAEDIFGDILPVHRNRVSIYHVWNGVIGPCAGELFGLEELMLALYEEPEMIHRFMDFCSRAIVKNYKQCEEAGDWSTADYWYYNTKPHCDALPDPEGGTHGAALTDLTGFCHAQEFESVSPDMFEEFLLEYQLPILELFGRVTYGCCDTLDTKMEKLNRIKNLTKVTVGPLANAALYPEPFGDRAVLSWRPVPSLLASETYNVDAQRKLFREGFEKLKGCQVELHLHDSMTVRNDLTRLFKWTEMAMEEAERAG